MELSELKFESSEFLITDGKLKDNKILLVALYWPPNQILNRFVDELENFYNNK